MSSVVDICNLALAHLGDTATVASIDPPEGSAQAELCAMFYPIARDALLEMHTWGFATRRSNLALLGSGWPEWDYAYAFPNLALNIIAVIPQDATDDYLESSPIKYVPQPFSCEMDDSGKQVIMTDLSNAVCRYTEVVTDTSRFSPLFVTALSWHLSSMLAGPMVKGDAGAAEGKRCLQMMNVYLSQAQESDASQRRIVPAPIAAWMSGR